MNAGSAHCYQIKVNTTNGMNDTFNLDGRYFDCENGHVYVLADTIEEAARLIPCAVAIKRVGFGMLTPATLPFDVPKTGNVSFASAANRS